MYGLSVVGGEDRPGWRCVTLAFHPTRREKRKWDDKMTAQAALYVLAGLKGWLKRLRKISVF